MFGLLTELCQTNRQLSFAGAEFPIATRITIKLLLSGFAKLVFSITPSLVSGPSCRRLAVKGARFLSGRLASVLRFTEPNLLVGRNEDATPCRNSTNAPFFERSETSFGEQNLRPMFQLSQRLLEAAYEKTRIQELMLWGDLAFWKLQLLVWSLARTRHCITNLRHALLRTFSFRAGLVYT